MLWLILLVLIPFVIAELCFMLRWGMIRDWVVCQHCGVRGKVRMKQVKDMLGPHDGATKPWVDGLRKEELVMKAHCGRCGMTWYFEDRNTIHNS
jgi:hypothetical protein